VSCFCSHIGWPCLKQCVHGASIGAKDGGAAEQGVEEYVAVTGGSAASARNHLERTGQVCSSMCSIGAL
jgi:hypothetical protein